MSRKIQVPAYSWERIPWNRNCDACVHFVAAPPNQQGQPWLMLAVWNHFVIDHHTELTGDPRLQN